jgi:hypothetical protein
MLDPYFFPLVSFLVVIICVESVKVAKHDNVAIGTGCPNRELTTLLVRRVIEALNQVPIVVVEGYLLVIPTRSNLLTISQCIRNAMVRC